ncbi:MAG TPA: OmpH family outer membrane protein [Acidiphilium sp.]|uniref:OmpH family outer membrane protein n=1 Tax=unclassified Acidiphilium TaxID=2617493 RepID=UPI00157A3886|nr:MULTISPECIES: OmpH family outer membrane protein [unclassified Acidiphilium]HQT59950.1 OmpH family outer membrane protein [Acidiphilium sp.]HQU11762.1 OmpH family outer membrane protein [Acidiphilium sp.]
MTRIAKIRAGLALPALIMAFAGTAHAQSETGKGYFIPKPKVEAPHTAPIHTPLPQQPQAPAGQQPGVQQVPPEKLPPIPQLAPLPKEKAPPAAVMGVLSVPDVMRSSTAAQGVEKIINERRQKLAEEAQADQKKWEGEQHAIIAEKGKLSKPALAAREQKLQHEIEQAQLDFHNRSVAIEVSARTALGKIESSLIAVIRQVAQAHGMNLVLHRSQVALNVNAFDITKEVADQLNKILPQVAVPPSVVPKMAHGAHKAAKKK